MRVILAEKPSVARDLATFVKATKRCDGYFEGEGVQVTWAFGHLVTLQEPEDYDPALKRWTLDTLPILPASFALKVIDDKGAKKQFSVIKRLFQSAKEIICATDAGREGELIFRYILTLLGMEKRTFQRLWLSSLTEEAIGKAFSNLRPGQEFDLLYAAARCRSESDWIVGLNATRYFTVRHGRGEVLWSVGRVQTPVLALIAKREEEISYFIPESFWELKTTYRDTIFRCKRGRCKKEEQAQEWANAIREEPFFIDSVDKKEEKMHPPFLYDLTDLQRDMNKRYGLSANETLQIAQQLYEDKLISYPRTDSKFLTSDQKKGIPQIFRQLKETRQVEIGRLSLDALSFSSRIINDEKAKEHHAIIPTGKTPPALSSSSQKVFHAILTRFISVFYPPCIREINTVEGHVLDFLFQTKGVQVLSPGWTLLYPKEEEKEEEEKELPLFTPGESGPHSPFVKQGKTEPPKPFTEASLLTAMETAGKGIEDEVLKEALKHKGLGTPATRASIIETLIKRGYINRERKNLRITQLGQYLIALVQDPHLKSPELTGEWEAKLREIEQGQRSAALFMEEIASYTKGITKESPLDLHQWGVCPCCGKSIIEGKRGVGCSGWKEGCSFVVWKEYKGTLLQPHQIRQLLQRKTLFLSHKEGSGLLYLSSKGELRELASPKRQEKPSTPVRRTHRAKG